ncbi:MAG: hypothetical protein V1707_03055 [bacterium]
MGGTNYGIQSKDSRSEIRAQLQKKALEFLKLDKKLQNKLLRIQQKSGREREIVKEQVSNMLDQLTGMIDQLNFFICYDNHQLIEIPGDVKERAKENPENLLQLLQCPKCIERKN